MKMINIFKRYNLRAKLIVCLIFTTLLVILIQIGLLCNKYALTEEGLRETESRVRSWQREQENTDSIQTK